MKRNTIILIVTVLLLVTLFFVFIRSGTKVNETALVPVVPEAGVTSQAESLDVPATSAPSERYSAQVDRVKVVFEHWNYTRYRLQTNELVREGDLNTERGFGDDPDATVFVLDWRKPEGEQTRYVLFTAEPGYLYTLDGNQAVIKSGRLVLE